MHLTTRYRHRVEDNVYLFFEPVSLRLSDSPNESISTLDTYQIPQENEVSKQIE